MAEDAQPPAFEPINNVQLASQKDSKILSVSVYSGRAEITRLFKFKVNTGQNLVAITELPTVMDQQSFRVEGRGVATIHDVTLSTAERPPAPTTSDKLQSLEADHSKTVKALARAEKALSSLQTYLTSLNSQHLDVTKLQSIVDNYDVAAEKLDDKVTELESKKEKLEKEIEEEKNALAGPKGNEKLDLKATISVFADAEGEVEIALIYAVANATWCAQYDIRVSMQTKEKPVTLLYKGAITQDTGEASTSSYSSSFQHYLTDWTDVPITLETAAPSFGVEIPELNRWTLSFYRPVMRFKKAKGGFGGGGSAPRPQLDLGGPPGGSPTMALAAFSRIEAQSLVESSSADAIQHRGLQVSSKGNITATFSVPGLMTIPSDNVAHKVTIVKLSLDATMEWVSVPKSETKVHLKAVVKNASEYTLLRGPASVYVDGSFISRSDVPPVSPEETFDCPLGLDPSIRVTYHPVSKKFSQSGFMSKTRNYVFSQRITVHNTKSQAIDNLTIVDQIPVSEESSITVKLLSPALSLPDFSATGTASSGSFLKDTKENKLGIRVPLPIKVSHGVVAQWDGVDEVNSEDGVENLGKDGKLNWVCSVPSQGKITLTLQWEVSAPLSSIDIVGF